MQRPRCYAVDDEPLALASMVRLLGASGRVEVVGHATDPEEALVQIPRLAPDALFLDIQMPELDGFQLLSALRRAPLVVFVTAYDHYAVRAFEVNSLDYLLKPVNEERLAASLDRLIERRRIAEPPPDWPSLLQRLSSPVYLHRVATRKADRFSLIPVSGVTHFVSEQRYTYAHTADQPSPALLDLSLSELEARLDPARFLRIHRSAIVNLDAVDQISRWFAGRVYVRLKDKTELTVSRDKVAALRDALGLK